MERNLNGEYQNEKIPLRNPRGPRPVLHGHGERSLQVHRLWRPMLPLRLRCRLLLNGPPSQKSHAPRETGARLFWSAAAGRRFSMHRIAVLLRSKPPIEEPCPFLPRSARPWTSMSPKWPPSPRATKVFRQFLRCFSVSSQLNDQSPPRISSFETPLWLVTSPRIELSVPTRSAGCSGTGSR